MKKWWRHTETFPNKNKVLLNSHPPGVQNPNLLKILKLGVPSALAKTVNTIIHCDHGLDVTCVDMMYCSVGQGYHVSWYDGVTVWCVCDLQNKVLFYTSYFTYKLQLLTKIIFDFIIFHSQWSIVSNQSS